MSRVRNDLFDNKEGYARGRPFVTMALWQLVKTAFFMTTFPWPSSVKVFWLRRFGTKIGTGACIKPRVNIHLPWKLTVGAHAWIGEDAVLLNFEAMKIGNHACISQGAFLCGGNHDFSTENMRYRHGKITVCDGAWVGARAFVAPGVTIGEDCVICACGVVTANMPAGAVCKGNPCKPSGHRWKSQQI
ncbi:MAG: WcaF family extracellular polysaccharide biosynthesis acetyltransferase [Opitutaceae bacterium]|nr:WcaF family extracellular polysaccharide biosynthesis acetyltransferase [Opitutaceae bacterium]